MGVWTRHVSDDGRVFYYNMKRNESRWAYEFQEKERKYMESVNDVGLALTTHLLGPGRVAAYSSPSNK